MGCESDAFKQSILHLRSGEFTAGVANKNLPDLIIRATQGILDSDEAMIEHTFRLVESASRALEEFYGDCQSIVIPYSGGRDSTLIALMTLANPQFARRQVKLVSALPGYSKGLENPRKQAVRIVDRLRQIGIDSPFNPEQDHIYLDISSATQELVLNQANQDLDRLGYPGFCSSCKVAMETSIAHYAANTGNESVVAMGYTYVQAQQQWPEQSMVQQQAMQDYLSRKYPTVRLGSPLFEVIWTPADTTLMLGYLGLTPDEHKCEMKCAAAGTNPREIHEPTLLTHVKIKQEEAARLVGTVRIGSMEGPEVSFANQIESLKGQSNFAAGAYSVNKS